jgi:hypothetical protein
MLSPVRAASAVRAPEEPIPCCLLPASRATEEPQQPTDAGPTNPARRADGRQRCSRRFDQHRWFEHAVQPPSPCSRWLRAPVSRPPAMFSFHSRHSASVKSRFRGQTLVQIGSKGALQQAPALDSRALDDDSWWIVRERDADDRQRRRRIRRVDDCCVEWRSMEAIATAQPRSQRAEWASATAIAGAE